MIEYIVENAGELLNAATFVVAAAASIAALTPTPRDEQVIGKIRKVVDFLALNFGNAKNEQKSEKTAE